jgi:hypothetical protein
MLWLTSNIPFLTRLLFQYNLQSGYNNVHGIMAQNCAITHELGLLWCKIAIFSDYGAITQ